MAKKRAKTAVWDTKPAGRASRQCENCGKYYFPRFANCPNCGVPNPAIGSKKRVVKKRITRKKRGRRPAAARAGAARGGNALHAAIEFVQQAGGLDNARAALETIERIRRL